MSKLPSYRRIIKSEYPDNLQESIEKLAFSVNPAFEVIFDILNRKLTLRDNIKCSVKEFIVSVDANGVPSIRIVLPLDFNGQVDGCIVLNAINIKNPAKGVNAAPFVSFSQNNNTIIVNNIKGLFNNEDYKIKLLIFGV